MKIDTNNIELARKQIRTAKKPVIVIAKDDEFNRAVLEYGRFDILLSVEGGKRKDKLKQLDSGLNEIVARIAAKNNVAIGIDFAEIFKLEGKEKAVRLARVMQNIKLCRKASCRIVLINCSDAKKGFDFMISLGASSKQAKEAIEADKLISKLKKHVFEKYESFSITPVISWEYAFYGGINNPYHKKLKISSVPNLIVLQDKNFEVWQEEKTKIRLKDVRIIREIINDSCELIEKYGDKVKQDLEIDISNINNKVAIKWLRSINDLFIILYNNYSFYTEEYFDTDDKNLLKELPEVRMKLSNFVDILWRSCNKILDYLKQKYKLPREVSDRLISSEILDILEEKADLTKIRKLKDRSVAFIIVDNEMDTIIGDKVSDIRNFLEGQNSIKGHVEIGTSKGQFYGSIAYKGVARGKVIKISENDYGNYKDIFKDKKDYVLVTPMTRPEIVPFLNNAKAIITDEGGITCHAAIVARELKKSCIIGTKIATSVLKDGDEVEVDADKGVVKILKRA